MHHVLTDTILSFKPNKVFEFGCGMGKNLQLLLDKSDQITDASGIDISEKNISKFLFNEASSRNGFIKTADETFLNQLNDDRFDVCFTCSVLDHIPDVIDIINNLKRLATKGVILAETNDIPGPYYYSHDYEALGFRKLNYLFKSIYRGDGALYHIWVYNRIT